MNPGLSLKPQKFYFTLILLTSNYVCRFYILQNLRFCMCLNAEILCCLNDIGCITIYHDMIERGYTALVLCTCNMSVILTLFKCMY